MADDLTFQDREKKALHASYRNVFNGCALKEDSDRVLDDILAQACVDFDTTHGGRRLDPQELAYREGARALALRICEFLDIPYRAAVRRANERKEDDRVRRERADPWFGRQATAGDDAGADQAA